MRRAALLGLFLGCLIAGVGLFAVGGRTLQAPANCDVLSENECMLESEIASDWARRQLWFGCALALLGVGGLLWQRTARLSAEG